MSTIIHHSFVILFLFFISVIFAQNGSPQFAQEQQFQLAPPILEHTEVFFQKSTNIQLHLGQENAQIRYTLDGSEPNLQSTLYQSPINLQQTALLKVKAFHDCCLPSETLSRQFFKVNQALEVKTAKLTHPPHSSYPGSGAMGLLDLKKGSSNFREKHWMGFLGKEVELNIELEETVILDRLTASILGAPEAWIFLPESMEVAISEDGENFMPIAQQVGFSATEDMPKGMQFLTAKFAPQQTRFIKILIKNQPAIPSWHPGKGKAAWLFVDEILLHTVEALTYQHPIPFKPKEYVCYRTDKPIEIDGKGDEESWQQAAWTADFVDIEGDLKPQPFLKTRMKMLWDENYFYFLAQMEEPHIWAKLQQRDTIIFYDDDFEILWIPMEIVTIITNWKSML